MTGEYFPPVCDLTSNFPIVFGGIEKRGDFGGILVIILFYCLHCIALLRHLCLSQSTDDALDSAR